MCVCPGPALKSKFFELFGCESQLDCDVFAGIDSTEATVAQLREIAVARGIHRSSVCIYKVAVRCNL